MALGQTEDKTDKRRSLIHLLHIQYGGQTGSKSLSDCSVGCCCLAGHSQTLRANWRIHTNAEVKDEDTILILRFTGMSICNHNDSRVNT